MILKVDDSLADIAGSFISSLNQKSLLFVLYISVFPHHAHFMVLIAEQCWSFAFGPDWRFPFFHNNFCFLIFSLLFVFSELWEAFEFPELINGNS